MIITLKGHCPYKEIHVLYALLQEHNMPPVMGRFGFETFVTEDDIPDVVADLIATYFKPDTFEYFKRQKISETKQYAATELSTTDYKVIRHRDQTDAGLPTTLTTTEYQQLLTDRQAIRDRSNEIKAQINAATTQAEVEALVTQ